jgi:FAD binding domain
MRRFDAAIIGAGPVGLLAALQLARAGCDVVIATKRVPAAGDPRRVDAVPAAFLALLIEFGIQPRSVGADALHTYRVSSWESEAPVCQDSPNSVHLERPALDLALLGALRRVPVAFDYRIDGEAIAGEGWCARRFIDATGRAATTAERRIRPPSPWVSRSFWTGREGCAASRHFAIAALPDGYAYRLGAASIVMLGVAGRGAAVVGTPPQIMARLRLTAPWILDGLPNLAQMHSGHAGAASVQWAQGHGLRIGDAALARDALSSQGLATGAAEALLATARNSETERDLIDLRQCEQRIRQRGRSIGCSWRPR